MGEHTALEMHHAALPPHSRQSSPATALLTPSWSSETSRRTPCSPRSKRPRSKEAYAAPFSELATSIAKTPLELPFSTPRHAKGAMLVTLAPYLVFMVGGVEVEVGVSLLL